MGASLIASGLKPSKLTIKTRSILAKDGVDVGVMVGTGVSVGAGVSVGSRVVVGKAVKVAAGVSV